MKKFRLLAAMVITVVMLFTVALAAEVSFDAIEYNGTDDTVTFVVKANNALAIDAYSTLAVDYDSDVYTVSSKTSSFAAAEITDYTGRIEWCNPTGDAAIAKDDALLTVVFTVKDKAAVVGSTFATNVDMTFVSAYNAGGDVLDMVASVTVEAAAADETVTGTATTDAKRELLLGGTYYTNLAVFDAEIPLVSTKNAKEIGWTLSAPEKADKVIKYTPQTAISGQGSIVFAAIVYNVPADVTITATPYVVYGN